MKCNCIIFLCNHPLGQHSFFPLGH